ncbi:hypothetical protein [Hyphomicrobium sp.]|uniref:hypothetical protein n=1 Tax=Hyphomicrobium sp. TaxID=82 RepID=UPI0025B8B3C1|nr:hypothetical protein [Hyphomicrobium sp.]MCC7251324.1 hypothetical protein [Hyphomicrobium sp.]
MGRKHRLVVLVALILAGAGAGCSGTAPQIGLPSPAETSAGVPSATAALQGILTPQDLVKGTPTEVYTRIARGVLTCWFGADGPLKAKYIYHADAEPASKGGRSEIKIMTRDREAEDPRALRAYRVVIAPSEDRKAKVEVENLRLPQPLAERFKLDVERWSKDEPGCGEGPVTAGWGAEPAIETSAPGKKEKSKKP